jgi:nitrite reductase/ring-hydroxylating ferredoxin subunit
MPDGPTRRDVLAGICGTAALAGCSAYGGSSDEPAAPAPATVAGRPIAKVADIPVGGGKVVSASGQSLLIVQPTAGQIKAFSANCTHQGTIIGDPVNGVSTCPNHGSRFNTADGSVLNGPAGTPLVAVNVTVTGDDITLA